MLLAIAIVILLVLLIIGVPIPFSFFASTVFITFTGGYDPSFLLPYGYSKQSTIVLLAIPLFIMAGGLIEKGNIGGKLVDLVDIFVGRIKGGLGIVAVVSCAIFGSITGSSCATLSCIGAILFPRLEKSGYDLGLSAALMANSAVLGILIPPSSIMILYAWVGNQSVLASFLSTIAPGILMVVLLSIINIVLVKNNKNIVIAAPMTSGEILTKLGKTSVKSIPALLMPVIVLGGIYGGILTPTEAAAVSVIYSIPIGFFVYKGLNKKNFKEVIVESGTTTGVVMIMLFCVMMLSRLYITEGLPTKILGILTAISPNKYVILFMLNIFMVIIGMLMDDVSGVLLATPILLPIALEIGVDPVHFAAIVGVNLGMGNITPPCAPLLYLSGRLSGGKINEMMKPSLIMLIFAWIPTLAITTFWPAFSTFIPNLILGAK